LHEVSIVQFSNNFYTRFLSSPLLSIFIFLLTMLPNYLRYAFAYIIMTKFLITFDLKSKYGCLEISVLLVYFKALVYVHSGTPAKNKF